MGETWSSHPSKLERVLRHYDQQRKNTFDHRRPADRCVFWLGNPHADTWPLLHDYFGTRTEDFSEMRETCTLVGKVL